MTQDWLEKNINSFEAQALASDRLALLAEQLQGRI